MIDTMTYRMCPGCGAIFVSNASGKRGESYRNGVCYYCGTNIDDAITEIDEFHIIDIEKIKLEYREKNIYPYPDRMEKHRKLLEIREQEKEEAHQFWVRQNARNKRDKARYGEVDVGTPKCPTCGSTSVMKISGVERGASILTLGIFSKKINKSFKCRSCGHVW